MKENFEKCAELVLASEGGYVDDSRDSGGATKYGVTLATLQAVRGGSVTKQDVANLTMDEASAIYRKLYWDKVDGDDLPAGVDYAVFDYAINSGPARAVKALQKTVGTDIDGSIGPKTMAALDSAMKEFGEETVIGSYCDSRLSFLKSLKTWKTFGKGWGRRVGEVEHNAGQMALDDPQYVAPTSGGSAKARDKDTAVSRTPGGIGAGAVGIGTIGAVVSDLAKQIQPLTDASSIAQYLFMALSVIGAGVTAYVMWKKFRGGAA